MYLLNAVSPYNSCIAVIVVAFISRKVDLFEELLLYLQKSAYTTVAGISRVGIGTYRGVSVCAPWLWERGVEELVVWRELRLGELD